MVSGGTGFIGSRLVLACLAAGESVVALGLRNTSAEEAKAASARVEPCAIESAENMAAALSGVDVVYHLAAAQHEVAATDDRFFEVNETGTKNLIEAAVRAGALRFVYGSTIGVYGDTDSVVDETTPCKPVNAYGRSKVAGENA